MVIRKYPAERLIADVRHQRHETSAFDRARHGVLADRSATTLAAAHNPAVAIRQLTEQLNVLVVDVQRAWTLAVGQDRILLFRSLLILGPAIPSVRRTWFLSWSWHRC